MRLFMGIFLGVLAIAFVTAFGPATPAQAQCAMWCPQGDAKAKQKKPVAAKKAKKEKVEYMRAAN